MHIQSILNEYNVSWFTSNIIIMGVEAMKRLCLIHGITDDVSQNSLLDAKMNLCLHFMPSSCTPDFAFHECPTGFSCVPNPFALSHKSELLHAFSAVCLHKMKIVKVFLRKLLTTIGLGCSSSDSLDIMHMRLEQYADTGDAVGGQFDRRALPPMPTNSDASATWSNPLSSSTKEQIMSKFKECISAQNLCNITCAVCGELHFAKDVNMNVELSDIDTSILRGEYPNIQSNPFASSESLRELILCYDGVVQLSSSGNAKGHSWQAIPAIFTGQH